MDKDFSVDVQEFDEGFEVRVVLNSYGRFRMGLTLEEAREICSALHRYDWAQQHEDEVKVSNIDPVILCANCESPIEINHGEYAGEGFFYWNHTQSSWKKLGGHGNYTTCKVHNHGLDGIDESLGDAQATHPTGIPAAEWVRRTH